MSTITSNPTFTITYKLIGESEEVSYKTKDFGSEEDLIEELQRRGSFGKVSYYRYSQKGQEPKRMYFI